ncbi:MAG: 50S ribosomal protein L4 [Candidatus Woesebacteria bacterium]
MKLMTITTSGKPGKEIESPIFDRVGSKTLVSQAVRVYLGNQRPGTAKTKTRAEVNLTKKKMYKQKHTGNARHGAQSAPIFVGGGVTHGPHGNTNWKLSMSKTMKKRALETVLGMQAKAEIISVIEGVEAMSGKTKEMIQALITLKLQDKAVLLVTGGQSIKLDRATQNIGNIFVCNAHELTTYFVARAQAILFTPEGLTALEQRLGDKEVTEAAPAKKTVKAEAKVAVEKTEVKKTVTKKPAVKKVAKTKTA